MDIRITHNLADVQRSLDKLRDDQIPFATALAMTRTAQVLKRELEAETAKVFDRPTPYTMRGWRLYPATKAKLEATVGFRSAFGSGSDARDYLGPNIFSGARKTTGLEKALQAAGHLPAGWHVVPGQGARLDAYGNASRGLIIQVLSQLRIQLTAGYDRNMPHDAKKMLSAVKRAGGRYFVVKPGQGKAIPGVYHRELMGRNVTPVFVFVKSVSYRRRLPMEEIGARVVRDEMPRQFEAAFKRAAATAR